MFSAHPAIVLSECFAERALNLLLQGAGLAVKRAHGVHGFVHAVGQSSALTVGKTKFADDARNPPDLAAQAESAPTVFTVFLPLGGCRQPHGQFACARRVFLTT